jgi:hypothetical protein
VPDADDSLISVISLAGGWTVSIHNDTTITVAGDHASTTDFKFVANVIAVSTGFVAENYANGDTVTLTFTWTDAVLGSMTKVLTLNIVK